LIESVIDVFDDLESDETILKICLVMSYRLDDKERIFHPNGDPKMSHTMISLKEFEN
jgi:hypothetical protein